MFNLNPQTLIPRLAYIIPALLISLTFHEFAHALVAVRQGDPTPRNQGRLSLNPRRHLDPFGTIMVLLAGFGFAKPVMVNPRNLKGELSHLMVSLAGPAANLLLAVLASVAVKFLALATSPVPGFPDFGAPCTLLSTPLVVLKTEVITLYTLNLYLMVFNLFPIPPLDGFEMIRTTLRKVNPRMLYQVESNRESIILVFIFVALVASPVIFFVLDLVARPVALLLGVPHYFPCQ